MRLGIEIGTSSARAAYLDERGRPCMVPGAFDLPALARQTLRGIEAGEAAAQALGGNAETTIRGCTRLMGRAGSLPAQLVERLPYPVREVGGEAVCNLLYAEVRASEVYGLLARELALRAEQSLGQAVDDVVLAVPASAEDRFRIQARAAVEAQGIRVRRLISQPAAALLALGERESQHAASSRRARRSARRSRVAVVNLGGSATEVSIAEREGRDSRVIATAGDMLLGGDDLIWAVVDGVNERFRHTAGIDVYAVDDGKIAVQGLRAAAEEALQLLRLAPETLLVLDHGGGFGRDLMTVLRRADVEAWLATPLERIAALCARAIEASGRACRRTLSAQEIDSVVLIGDAAELPGVAETVARAFARPVATLHTHNATRLAVFGAALASAADAPIVWDVTPYPLGINCYYDDVELFSPIIPANAPIPTVGADGAYTQEYWTRYPDQTRVTLDVLQYRGVRIPDLAGSGRVYPHECETLGSWEFAGLRPTPGQRVPFTVTFAIDADGILHLYARETRTGHSLAARIERGIG